MKYFTTFTGVGGLDMGLEDRGYECVGFSEIKKSSIDVYLKHYPKHKNFGDITKVDPKILPDFDIITGGFPCQSFSIAGARRGFEDPKGVMVLYLYKILVEKKPKFAVFENVKGILSHNSGMTFLKVFKLFEDAGYFVRVVLLNSMYYGSAQSRERVFFLLSRDDDFKELKPDIVDDTKRFRDIRELGAQQRMVKMNKRNELKIEQMRGSFSFELIGGYDRVGTLTTQMGCGEKLAWDVETESLRLLTPLECERLQGFPDNWTMGLSDSARYFAMGNAVNCNVSKYLFGSYLPRVWPGLA